MKGDDVPHAIAVRGGGPVEMVVDQVQVVPVAVAAVPRGGVEQQERAHAFLADQDFPPGLAALVCETSARFPLRYWIVDNSGSMMTADGHRQTAHGPVVCTRWEELQESVAFHGRLAESLGGVTEFRLLNQPLGGQQVVHVGGGDPAGLDTLSTTMKTDPSGRTPLCGHLQVCLCVYPACVRSC